jgi:hypothetical protein
MLERKSVCCGSSVRVVGRKNTNYWVCVGCSKACDAVLDGQWPTGARTAAASGQQAAGRGR